MEPTQPLAASPAPRRTMWGVLLVVCSLWVGFVAGMAVGGRFFVPAGSGLSGTAIALSYGFLGALAGALLAGVLAWKLPMRSLRLSVLIALLLSALTILFVGYRVVRTAAQITGT